MVSQLCLMCGSTLNCQTLCLGARPWYSLVVDKDVKKPTNQPTLKARVTYWVFYRKFKYLQRQWLHFPWIKDKNDKILVRKIRLPNHLVMSQNSLEMVSFTMLNILFWLSLQVNLQNTAFGKSATEKAMSVGEITNELKIMKEEMRHPNIVRYYKTFELGEEWYFLPFFFGFRCNAVMPTVRLFTLFLTTRWFYLCHLPAISDFRDIAEFCARAQLSEFTRSSLIPFPQSTPVSGLVAEN